MNILVINGNSKNTSTTKAIIDELKAGQYEAYDLPELSFSNKVFQDDAEKCMMSCSYSD